MNFKNAYKFVFLILLLFANHQFLKANTLLLGNISNIDELSIQKNEQNSISSEEELIEKEINYYAPQSGLVYLAWKTSNYSSEDALAWNVGTKFTDGLLYTTMVANGGTFTVSLKMPRGANIEYHFWITKDNKGSYQDFWDTKSKGFTSFIDSKPIHKKAVYFSEEKNDESIYISYGWLFLIIFTLIFFLTHFIKNKFVKDIIKIGYTGKTLFLGCSMFLFYMMARSEIVFEHPKNLFTNWKSMAILFMYSLHDLLYVIIFVTFFIILFVIMSKHDRSKKIIYNVALFLGYFSTIVAFTNILTVRYLGKPFNYEWLYYSDFLGSDDAKKVFEQNLSIKIFLSLIAIGLSALILSNAFRNIWFILKSYKVLRNFIFSLFLLGSLGLMIFAFTSNRDIDRGKSDNAILAMLFSMLNSGNNASFFSKEIPNDLKLFVPKESQELKNPLENLGKQAIKNVICIVLESSGAEYFDSYGGKFQLNSNLNKYSNQALIFDNAYAHAPATNKSLVSLLGSIYPYVSYKSLTQEAPNFNHPTLSSVLKEKGYKTSFFSSANLNFQNSYEFLKHRGFDVIEDLNTINCENEFKQDVYEDGNGLDDMCLSERLKSWLDEEGSDNFLSILWTVQAHYPYFLSQDEEDFGVNNINFNRYLNVIKHNDAMIGNVMEILKEKQLDSSTLVIIMGDHGEAFGQHNQYGHGSGIYEENLRIPLYFINPIVFNGERRKDIASMKDIATTALSVLEIDVPKVWQGIDLINTYHNEAFFFAPWSDHLFGYRKDNMKYIFNESLNKVEVYDLHNDPKESINLYNAKMEEDVEYAKLRIASWIQYQDIFVKQKLKELE